MTDNAGVSSHLGQVEYNLAEDMDAFDKLPPALRQTIRDAPYKVCAMEMRDALWHPFRLWTVPRLQRAIRDTGERIRISEGRP